MAFALPGPRFFRRLAVYVARRRPDTVDSGRQSAAGVGAREDNSEWMQPDALQDCLHSRDALSVPDRREHAVAAAPGSRSGDRSLPHRWLERRRPSGSSGRHHGASHRGDCRVVWAWRMRSW